MKLMRPLLTWLLILALRPSYATARIVPAPSPACVSESLATLKMAYQRACATLPMEIEAAHNEAKKNGQEKNFQYNKPYPNVRFSPRFLAVAAGEPRGPDAADALRMTLQTSEDRFGAALGTRAAAVKILREHYADTPEIAGFLKILAGFSDEESKALMAEIIARHPDRKVQLAAYREQIAYRESLVRFAESLRHHKQRATLAKAFVIEHIGKAETAGIEVERIKKILREKYSDLYVELPVGAPAPEVQAQYVTGTTGPLSALKGKVVVLEIWATWCGPCRAMIPHERAMLERLKDKPFELVAVSIDDDLKTLEDFLTKENLPWTHWWAGPGGKESAIAAAWNVQLVPAVFVLDTKGVIRYKDIRGEELEKAVNVLLATIPESVAAKASK